MSKRLLYNLGSVRHQRKLNRFHRILPKEVLLHHLQQLVYQPKNATDRLNIAKEKLAQPFSRKAYCNLFKNISTATASRDLKSGLEQGFLLKSGDKRTTVYQFKN